MSSRPSRTQVSLHRHVQGIFWLAGFLVVGAGGLAAATKLAGAVVANGTLVVSSAVKVVRHTTGGLVATVAVGEGSRVRAGDLLVRLDDTTPRATRDMIAKQMWDCDLRAARLEAEGAGADAISFPAALLADKDPELARMREGEQRLFAVRRDAREGQRRQLRQQIAQAQDEIDGLEQQLKAKGNESDIVAHELVGVHDLYNRNLVQLPRLDALERDAARIGGERGQLTASIARARGRIAEINLKILGIDDDLRNEVGKEGAEIRAKRAELAERRIVADDQLAHVDIRAPQGGYVHDLAVHARGAVVTPGADILTIVPDADALLAQVHVRPQDVDKVAAGTPATLRFANFDGRTTADVPGTVTRVAADVTPEGKGGAPAFYAVDITFPAAALSGPLRPGMPVDAFVKTSDRTILAYLLKPLSDQVSRAFREK